MASQGGLLEDDPRKLYEGMTSDSLVATLKKEESRTSPPVLIVRDT